MMDRPAIHAAEAFVDAGYPLDAEALLIVELDGAAGRGRPSDREGRGDRPRPSRRLAPGQPRRGRAARLLGRAQGRVPGGRAASRPIITAWTARSRAAGWPRCCAGSARCREKHGLRVANVFHAGDGNLHPLILYDANEPGEIERAEAFGADILRLCVEVGGVLTGEHGVGVEKRDLMGTMFDETDLAHQQRLKCAFDPDGLLNPGKVFPQLAPLRRTGPAARPCRPPAPPRPAAVLVPILMSAARMWARQQNAVPPEVIAANRCAASRTAGGPAICLRCRDIGGRSLPDESRRGSAGPGSGCWSAGRRPRPDAAAAGRKQKSRTSGNAAVI